MMPELLHPTLNYQPNREPFHDGMDEECAVFSIACPRCGHEATHNAFSSISSGTLWFRGLPYNEQREISRTFGLVLRLVGDQALAYCFFPNLRVAYPSQLRCDFCNTQSVVVIDFYERQPARYIGVLQGLAALRASNSIDGQR